MLEEVLGSRQVNRARTHGRAPNPKGPWDPSFAVCSTCVLMKGCPAQYWSLLGPERSGHLCRDETMGRKRDSLPCVSERPFKGHLGGQL